MCRRYFNIFEKVGVVMRWQLVAMAAAIDNLKTRAPILALHSSNVRCIAWQSGEY
jgi:hypothetical protein